MKRKNKTIKKMIISIVAIMIIMISCMIIKSFAYDFYLVRYANGRILVNDFDSSYCLNWSHACRTVTPGVRAADPLVLAGVVKFYRTYVDVDGRHYQYNPQSAYMAWIAMQGGDDTTFTPPDPNFWDNCRVTHISPMQFAVWRYADAFLRTPLYGVGTNAEFIPAAGYNLDPSGLYHGVPVSDGDIGASILHEINSWATEIMADTATTSISQADGFNVETKFGLNGKTYVKIGPVRIAYSGEAVDVGTFAKNGEKLNSEFYKYVGNQLSQTGFTDPELKAGAPFYILLPRSDATNRRLLRIGVQDIKLISHGGNPLPENDAEGSPPTIYWLRNVQPDASVHHQDHEVNFAGFWQPRNREASLPVEVLIKEEIIIRKYGLVENENGEFVVDQEAGMLGGAKFRIFNETTRQYVQIPRSYLLAETYGQNPEDGTHGYDPSTGTYTCDYYQPESSKDDPIVLFETKKGLPIILDNLIDGEYTVEEVEPPLGYELSNNPGAEGGIGKISIPLPDGSDGEMHFHNKEKPGIKIKKYGLKDDGEIDIEKGILQGARFLIRKVDGDKVQYIKHDDGYNWQDHDSSYMVKEDDYIDESEIDPEDLKTDSHFTFTNVVGQPLKIFDLKEGKYEIEETVPPDEYDLSINGDEDGNILEFKVPEDLKKTFEFYNPKERQATLTIKKVDEKGIGLGGAGFTIQRKDGQFQGRYVTKTGELVTKQYTIETPKSGEIYIEGMLEGEYIVREVYAPDGYILPNPNEWTITVKKQQENIIGPIVNKKEIVQKLTFKKVDKDSGKGLEGFKFDIKVKSLREEYIKVYPNYFDPNDPIYKDPVGNVNFYNGDSHCEINLKADDSLYASDWEDRWEVVRQEWRVRQVWDTREVPDGFDEEGNPKTKTESYLKDEPYLEDVYGWVRYVVEWTCRTHGDKFGEFEQQRGQQHCNTYNQAKTNAKNVLRQKMERFHAQRESVAKQLSPRITDKNGYADLSKLRFSSDDKHGLFYMVETSVGSNPYYDVDSSPFDIDYLTETNYIERANKRKRLDIEGYVWEDKGASGKDYASNTTGIGLFEAGKERLISPVEVVLYNGDREISKTAVVTSNGKYRLRVNVSDFESFGNNIRVVFIYNGLKYESVFVGGNGDKISSNILNAENGTKALEAASVRDKFNQQLAQINTNRGYNDSNFNNGIVEGTRQNDGKQIEYTALQNWHSSTIKYEGSVTSNDGYKCNEEKATPTGDAKYDLQKMPGQDQIDPNTNRQEAPNPYDDGMSNKCYYVIGKNPETSGTTDVLENTKYQIQADTSSAGYSVYNQFDKIIRKQGLDTIKNDIYAVMVQSNGQKKWYKYGENMQDINYKESVDKVLGLRFGNNKKIGTYTREVSPSEVEAADSTNFEIRVVYETKIRNESSTLYMKPNEIVSFYDTKYEDEVKNVSSTPWDESRPAEINVSWQKDASHVRNGRHSQSHQDYKAAYGEVQWGTGVPIKNQKSVSIYTQYTIKRNQAYKIYEGDVVFYNQVEINSYSTSDEYLHKRTAINKNYYAGIDSDSAAGSAKIEPENDKGFESWEDDTDDAPDFKLQKAKNRKIQGTVFKDTIITSGAEGGEYRGNGVNDGDKPLSGVRVELVELNDNGTEKLWDHNVSEAEDNPYKPNSSNILQRSGERQQNTTMVELDEDLDNPSSTVQALKYTGNDGKYEFSGFIPGRYIIKFTWGGECSTVPVNVANTDEYIYPEQYKSTTFVDRNRYNEYTGGGSNPTRWLLRNDYRRNSNAIDDMEKRFELDQKMLEVDGSTSGYGNFVDIAEKGTIMNSRTPAFEVGVEALDKDKDGGNANKEAVDIGKGEQGSDQVLLNADGLDFGICERPKMGISLKKEVERVKVTLANGQTLVDAEVNGGTMLRGVILGTTIMPPNPANPATGYKGDIGKFKIEMDGEIMQGAILEITYKYTIINKSNKDFVITSGDSNNPYLFKEHTDQNTYFKFNEISLADQDVEIEPTIIVDYLSNGMNYLREEEGDKNVPEENSCWERVSEDEQQERITKHFFNFRNTILYGKYKNEENRYEDYYRDGRVLDHDSEIIEDTDKRMDVLNKYYWTIVRDQERNASADRIRLKAGYQAERKFVASKVLTSTNEDMEFYNSAEIIKITKNGGAQPERQIPGDELPLKEVTSDVYTADLQPAKEEDGSTAEYTTITGPTGDIYNNYEKGVIIAVALAGLSILGIGTAIIRRIVFTMENRKQKIKKQKGGKQKKTK